MEWMVLQQYTDSEEGVGWMAKKDIPCYTRVLVDQPLGEYSDRTRSVYDTLHSTATATVREINGFCVNGQVCVFEHASRFNHRCYSNCYYYFVRTHSGHYEIHVITCVPVEAGQQLTINYFGVFSIARAQRSLMLLERWSIQQCQCMLCTDERISSAFDSFADAVNSIASSRSERLKKIREMQKLLAKLAIPSVHAIQRFTFIQACCRFTIASSPIPWRSYLFYHRKLNAWNKSIGKEPFNPHIGYDPF
jgi:hypothetical protein